MKHDKLFTMSIHEFNTHLGGNASRFSNAPAFWRIVILPSNP